MSIILIISILRNFFDSIICLMLVLNMLLCVILLLFLDINEKVKKIIDLKVTKLKFVVIFVNFVCFIFFFVIWFRLLNLFRTIDPINLQVLLSKLFSIRLILLIPSMVLIILVLLIFFSIIRTFIYLFKLSFLRLHYYLLCPDNFKYFNEYSSILYWFVTWPNRFLFHLMTKYDIFWFQINREKIYLVLRYGFTVIIIILFLIDVLFNNKNLVFFMKMLPWYSLYNLLYNLNSFLYYRMEFIYDIVISATLYSGNPYSEFKLYFESYNNSNTNLETDDYFYIRNHIRNKLLKQN